MEAGLELFGTVGYARTSVRAVSVAASLNSRYFYESFRDREDLLYCVYERIVGDIYARVREAIARETTLEGQARAGLRAGWMAVTEDRRKARVVAIEVVGVSERLERLRRETRHALARLTADGVLELASGGPLRLDPVITARFLIGGVSALLADWVNGDLDLPTDEVIEHFTSLVTAAAYAAMADGPSVRRTLPGLGELTGGRPGRGLLGAVLAFAGQGVVPHPGPAAGLGIGEDLVGRLGALAAVPLLPAAPVPVQAEQGDDDGYDQDGDDHPVCDAHGYPLRRSREWRRRPCPTRPPGPCHRPRSRSCSGPSRSNRSASWSPRWPPWRRRFAPCGRAPGAGNPR
jgi:AcrR family transcriptional regulator